MSIWEKTKQFMGFEEELLESSPLKIQKVDRHKRKEKGGRVINFPKQKHTNTINPSQNEVLVIEPRAYEDSLHVSTWLKRGNPVVVNIKHLDASTGKRFIDFICGSAYAFEGHMHRLGGTIFMFTPAHMAIIPANEENAEENRPEVPQTIYEEESSKHENTNYTEQPSSDSSNYGDYEYYDPTAEETTQEAIYA